MRLVSLGSIGLLVGLGSVIACFPASGVEDDSEGAGADLTGGSTAKVESPVVFLFERPDMDGKRAMPKCSGALIADKIVVTARSCARMGLLAGRAQDDDGHGKRANVLSVQLPDEADAEIAVLELDASIGGTPALITHAPLLATYTVDGVVASDGRGLFPSEHAGDAQSIDAKLVSETASESLLLPTAGSQLCTSDLGAVVCSSTSTRGGTFNTRVLGTCGLAGLVVGQPDAPPVMTVPAGTQAPTPVPALGPNGCSGNPWKVASLGRHAAFLKRVAPQAFQPMMNPGGFFSDGEFFAPPGLWGFKTSGQVRSCKVTTARLGIGTASIETAVTAVATFARLDERSEKVGRFGIAPKANPSAMRWVAAKAGQEMAMQGNAVQVEFSGSVNAAIDGDYVVAFRASGSGGEDWTMCDLDGSENGFTEAQLLSLHVGTGSVTPPPQMTPPVVTPPGMPPPPVTPTVLPDGGIALADGGVALPDGGTANTANPLNSSTKPPSYTENEDRTSANEETNDESDAGAPTRKKKKAASGCSAAPGRSGQSGQAGGNGLPILGLLLGFAAFFRRKK